ALTKVCDAVAVGDLTSRVASPGTSELGVVATSLNTMLDNTAALVQSKDDRDRMQSAIMKLLDEIAGIAEGDLTKDAEVSADVTGAIADSFNFMIAELRGIIGQVQKTTQNVTASLGECAASRTTSRAAPNRRPRSRPRRRPRSKRWPRRFTRCRSTRPRRPSSPSRRARTPNRAPAPSRGRSKA